MTSTSICQTCSGSFKPTPGAKGIYCSPVCTHQGASKRNKEKCAPEVSDRRNSYAENPNTCAQCSSPLEYKKRKNKFCSSSCAAIFNNTGKVKSSATKFRIAQKSAQLKNVILDKTEDHYVSKLCRHCNQLVKRPSSVYCNQDCALAHKRSKIKPRICAICTKQFQSTTHKHVCPNHEHMFLLAKRAPFEFKFNVFDYPQLFDLTLLSSVGFKTRLNPNGFVRDHKVSIYEAIKHGHDPYYISHVLNCELLLSKENLAKGKSSSITYDELKRLVDEWDSQAHLISTLPNTVATK